MFIKSLKFIDHAEGWELEKTEFSAFNLLVGASGTGKSQTLEAINYLYRISDRGNFEGVEWDAIFTDENNRLIEWKGRFATQESSKKYYRIPRANVEENFKIEYEYLSVDGQILLERDKKNNLLFAVR